MLVLSRKPDESIVIGNEIVITVIEIRGEKVRIGITAPKNIAVYREEIFRVLQAEKKSQEKQNLPET